LEEHDSNNNMDFKEAIYKLFKNIISTGMYKRNELE
jgi:hypothetical protein